jgi:hypothetical protein
MNALLYLLKLLYFNASVCQPEYIVQLGLLRDNTGNGGTARHLTVTRVSVLCRTSKVIPRLVSRGH